MSEIMLVRKRAWSHAFSAVLLALFVTPLTPAIGQVAFVELIPLQAASASDTTTTLPTALKQLDLGQAFVVEVWAQTSDTQGLSSVSTTIQYDPAIATVTGVIHTTLFSELSSGTEDNILGTVAGLSGSHLSSCVDQVGVTPAWARVAILNMLTESTGSLFVQSADTGMPALGTAICGVGDLLPAQVAYGSATLNVSGAPIPTISQWGLIVLVLMMLSVGSVTFSRRTRCH